MFADIRQTDIYIYLYFVKTELNILVPSLSFFKIPIKKPQATWS